MNPQVMKSPQHLPSQLIQLDDDQDSSVNSAESKKLKINLMRRRDKAEASATINEVFLKIQTDIIQGLFTDTEGVKARLNLLITEFALPIQDSVNNTRSIVDDMYGELVALRRISDQTRVDEVKKGEENKKEKEKLAELEARIVDLKTKLQKADESAKYEEAARVEQAAEEVKTIEAEKKAKKAAIKAARKARVAARAAKKQKRKMTEAEYEEDRLSKKKKFDAVVPTKDSVKLRKSTEQDPQLDWLKRREEEEAKIQAEEREIAQAWAEDEKEWIKAEEQHDVWAELEAVRIRKEELRKKKALEKARRAEAAKRAQEDAEKAAEKVKRAAKTAEEAAAKAKEQMKMIAEDVSDDEDSSSF